MKIKQTLVAVSVTSAFAVASVANAEDFLLNKDYLYVTNGAHPPIEEQSFVVNKSDSEVRSILRAGDGGSITVLSGNIDLSQTIRNDTDYQGYSRPVIAATKGGSVTIGERGKLTGTVKVSSTAYNDIAVGLEASPRDSGKSQKGGQIEINADTLEITASSNYFAKGIFAYNGTTNASVDDVAKVIVNTNSTVINVSTTNEYGAAIGLNVWSQAQVILNSDYVEINADSVINTRGNGVVEINAGAAADKTVKLKGDIVFEYSKSFSGTPVDSSITIGLVGANSYWTGSAIFAADDKPNDESYSDVNNLKVTIADKAQWTPGTVTESELSNSVAISELTFNDGIININEGKDQIVKVDSLKGSGGTVNVKASTSDGTTFESGVLQVEATDENVTYDVNFTGITADDVKDSEKAFEALNAAVDTGNATVKKSNRIAEGAVRGEMTQTVDQNGEKSEIEVSRNTKLTAFESISALPMLSLRHELNSLNKRMGELRDSPAGIGSWVRIYGSETEYGAQSIESKNTTIQVGSDVSVGDWKVGLAAHYTNGESTYANGLSDSKDYGIALYGTWLAQCGAYVDMIAKYTRIDTDFALNGMNGNYDNNAFTASVEAGYRLNFMDNRVFVEPQVELSYGYVTSTDFTTGNDVHIQQDSFESTIGRIGVRTGFTFPNNKGSVYARVSGVYDFQGEMTGMASLVNDASVREALKEDLGGSWIEYGVGANFNWSDTTYMYIDLERTSGGEVRENYRWNMGLRHIW